MHFVTEHGKILTQVSLGIWRTFKFSKKQHIIITIAPEHLFFRWFVAWSDLAWLTAV